MTFSANHSHLEWAQWIQGLGLIPPLSLLKKALLTEKDMTAARLIADMGVVLDGAFLREVCFEADSDLPIAFLIDIGLKPDECLFNELYQARRFETAQLLIKKNAIQPTESMMIMIIRFRDRKMMDFLFNYGVRLSTVSLNALCCRPGESRFKTRVISRCTEFLSAIQYINSFPLGYVEKYSYSIVAVTFLSDAAVLSLLHYLKQVGTQMTPYILEYVSRTNRTQCVRWLVQEGVALPQYLFNSLASSFNTEIQNLLSSSYRYSQRSGQRDYQPNLTFFSLHNQAVGRDVHQQSLQSTFRPSAPELAP